MTPQHTERSRTTSGRVRARLVQMMRRLAPVRPRDPSLGREDRFWLCFELELERARRHERSFAVTRLMVGDVHREHIARSVDELSSSLRTTDALVIAGDRILALWSEADREAADVAVGRLLSLMTPGAIIETETFAFPDDGLAAAAIVDHLANGMPVPTPHVWVGHDSPATPPNEPQAVGKGSLDPSSSSGS